MAYCKPLLTGTPASRRRNYYTGAGRLRPGFFPLPKPAQEAEAAVRELRRDDETGFYGSLSARTENVHSEDWENIWKQYYKPFAVGQRLLVRPSWESADNPEGRRVLVIDPASSFGTGSHATTRLCMEALDKMDVSGANVLDMGCGSGILGAAAALLGAEKVTLCDIDETAVRTAVENVRRSSPGVAMQACCGDWLQQGPARHCVTENAPYDVICANIVADVLIAMCKGLCNLLRPGGCILLSGIIESRCEEVRSAYLNAGMNITGEEHRDGWVMICSKK